MTWDHSNRPISIPMYHIGYHGQPGIILAGPSAVGMVDFAEEYKSNKLAKCWHNRSKFKQNALN